MRVNLLLFLVLASNFSFSQESENVDKHHSRLTRKNYYKLDFGQLIMLEGGLNYEHNFNGLWSFVAAAGVNKGSLFYTAGSFGKNIEFNDFHSNTYKWGWFLSAGARRYLNKLNNPFGFYSEVEFKYKNWSKSETDTEHGGAMIYYTINDAQIIPVIGYVHNRLHRFEAYIGCVLVNSTGVGDGKVWGLTPNEEYPTGYLKYHEKVNFFSVRPKFGFRLCF